MPQTVLLSWELGGGLGHIQRLVAVARALVKQGFVPILAVQRLDAPPTIYPGPRSDYEFFQAPLWPGLLRSAPDVGTGRVTMGDVLAEYGLLRPDTTEYLLRAWDQLLARIEPAVVVADFAPASLMAARGRIPTVAIGNGYTVPPAQAKHFQLLAEDSAAPKHDEAVVLASVNEALARIKRPPLERYPAIFEANRTCIACFEELDPFLPWRQVPNLAPFLPEGCRQSSSRGDEIFVYFVEAIARYPTIIGAIKSLAQAGLPVRMHVPNLSPTFAAELEACGVLIERTLVPLEQIAARSAMILSHGGLGMAHSALVAGIPHVIVPLDLEKRFNGNAVERIGLGRCFRVTQNNPLEVALLATAIRETYEDKALWQRAREAAPAFAARLKKRPEEEIAEVVARIV